MYDGIPVDLIDQFGQLPSIGPKSMQRIATHVLDAKSKDVVHLIDAVNAVCGRVRHYDICGNLTEEDECSVCRGMRRDPSVICVIQESRDVQAVEGAHVSRGRYHVLGDVIDPIRGVGPDQPSITSLMSHPADSAIVEVILATSPNVEGEATAAYFVRMLSTIGVETSCLAIGLPTGSDLEYADSVTLGRALERRHRLQALIDKAVAASRSQRAGGHGLTLCSGGHPRRRGTRPTRDLRSLSRYGPHVPLSVTHV